MPTRIDVWDRQAGRAISMFSGDAADAVANDPARYTLDIPAGADPSPPAREFDSVANLFKGPSTGVPTYDRSSSYRNPPRRPNRRRA